MIEQDYHSCNAETDGSIHSMANELQDTLLLAKLSSGDMIAMDAVYHKHCLTALFTRYRSSIRQKESSILDEKLTCEAIALAELIS